MRTAKYLKQKLIKLKREIDKPKIVAVDFHTLVSTIARMTRQIIRNDIYKLNWSTTKMAQ